MNGILPAPSIAMPQGTQRLEIGRQRSQRRARIREQAEDGRRDDRAETRAEALGEEVAARHGPLVRAGAASAR